jgi:hypothetical protein
MDRTSTRREKEKYNNLLNDILKTGKRRMYGSRGRYFVLSFQGSPK